MTADILRSVQKENPAVTATGQVRPQIRPGPKHRPQNDIVFQDKLKNLAPVVPIRAELVKLPNPYDKKARVSLMMLIRFSMPSSYLISLSLSR